MCVFIPIKNWCQEQKFGPCGWIQHPISSILQHVFWRSLSLPVSLLFPSIQMDFQLCNGNGIRRQLWVDWCRIWCKLHIMAEFIPISSMGKTSTTNFISILTALLMISTICNSSSWLTSFEYSRHAKSQCSPLSWLISSLLKLSPGIRPRFLRQKMAQKDPEKKLPSTAANAIVRSAKLAVIVSHHLNMWIIYPTKKSQRH